MTNLEQTVDMRLRVPGRWRGFGFIGPAAMVSVGYMDPGNWATDLEGRSEERRVGKECA